MKYTAVLRKVVPQKRISVRDNVKRYYGYWWPKVSDWSCKVFQRDRKKQHKRVLMLPFPSCWNNVNRNQATINYHGQSALWRILEFCGTTFVETAVNKWCKRCVLFTMRLECIVLECYNSCTHFYHKGNYRTVSARDKFHNRYCCQSKLTFFSPRSILSSLHKRNDSSGNAQTGPFWWRYFTEIGLVDNCAWRINTKQYSANQRQTKWQTLVHIPRLAKMLHFER